MKRHIDVSGARSAGTDDQPAVAGPITAQSARPVDSQTSPPLTAEAAEALLTLAIQDSTGPIDNLSRALGRMAQALATVGARPQAQGDAAWISQLEDCRAVFAREMAICIQSMQFHDRLSQQLTQAQAILEGVATTNRFSGVATAATSEGSIELF